MGQKFHQTLPNMDLFKFENGIPTYDGKVINITTNDQGYNYVRVGGVSYKLHRLVAEKYIPNPEGNPIVDHKDGDKSNNFPSNLKWVTYSENSKAAFDSKTNMKNFHDKGSRRIIIAEKDGVITEHESLRKCAKYLDRNVAAVYRVLNGSWKRCNGHTLRYK